MPRNQKILLTILGIYVIFDFVLGSILGLYLWESSKSATTILAYYLTLFTSIMVITRLSSSLTKRFGIKTAYIFSITLGIAQALILLGLGSSVQRYIIPFGILAGLNIGIQSFAYTLTVSKVTEGDSSTHFLGLKSSVMNLISLISIPALTTVIKVTGSYTLVYQLGLVLGLAIIFLITRLSLPSSNADLLRVRSSPYSLLRIDEVRLYLTTRFLYGIFNGPLWAILGVVTYIFVDDVSIWGVITTFFTALNIVGAYLYSKINHPEYHQAVSVLGTFIFGTLAILLATNWNLVTFLAYQLGLVLLNSSFAIHYESVIFNLKNTSPEINANMTQVISLGELAVGFGRILPLFILIIGNFSFDNPIMLQLLFILISAMPLLILSTLACIVPHSQRYAKINSTYGL